MSILSHVHVRELCLGLFAQRRHQYSTAALLASGHLISHAPSSLQLEHNCALSHNILDLVARQEQRIAKYACGHEFELATVLTPQEPC